METVVIYNQGKDAARAGSPRVAPASIMYPIVSRYQDFRREEAFLDGHQKTVWLQGWDAGQAALA